MKYIRPISILLVYLGVHLNPIRKEVHQNVSSNYFWIKGFGVILITSGWGHRRKTRENKCQKLVCYKPDRKSRFEIPDDNFVPHPKINNIAPTRHKNALKSYQRTPNREEIEESPESASPVGKEEIPKTKQCYKSSIYYFLMWWLEAKL